MVYKRINYQCSANWITDFTGTPIQYIYYAPYRELIEKQQTIGYDEQGRKIFQLAGNGVWTDCYKEEYLPLQKFTFFNFYRQSTCTYHSF